jgi:hypothetical protein
VKKPPRGFWARVASGARVNTCLRLRSSILCPHRDPQPRGEKRCVKSICSSRSAVTVIGPIQTSIQPFIKALNRSATGISLNSKSTLRSEAISRQRSTLMPVHDPSACRISEGAAGYIPTVSYAKRATGSQSATLIPHRYRIEKGNKTGVSEARFSWVLIRLARGASHKSIHRARKSPATESKPALAARLKVWCSANLPVPGKKRKAQDSFWGSTGFSLRRKLG